jgi:hypothetical protein
MIFKVRIVGASDDTMTVSARSGRGAVDVDWPVGAPLEVVVSGDGATSRSVTLPFPPSSHEIAVVREKAPVASVDLRGGIAHLGATGDGRAFATLRSGVVVLVDAEGGEVARHTPTSFETPKFGPVRSGDRVLVVMGSGRVRVLAYPSLEPQAAFTLSGEVRGAAPAADGFAVVVGGDVLRVPRSGAPSKSGEAPRGVRDLVFDGNATWGVDAAGAFVRVDLEKGTVLSVDRSGNDLRPLGDGCFARRAADGWWTVRDSEGRVLGGISPSRVLTARVGARLAVTRQDGRIDFLPTPSNSDVATNRRRSSPRIVSKFFCSSSVRLPFDLLAQFAENVDAETRTGPRYRFFAGRGIRNLAEFHESHGGELMHDHHERRRGSSRSLTSVRS